MRASPHHKRHSGGVQQGVSPAVDFDPPGRRGAPRCHAPDGNLLVDCEAAASKLYQVARGGPLAEIEGLHPSDQRHTLSYDSDVGQ